MRLSARWLLLESPVSFQLPPAFKDVDGVKAHYVNKHIYVLKLQRGMVTMKSFGLRNIPIKWVNQLLFLSIRPVWVYM